MSATKRASLLQTIDAFLKEIDTTKTAAEEAPTEHPSKSVDDNTQGADTGSRASENTKDVKKDVPGGNVDSTSESVNKGDNQLNIGLTQSATGEDPSVEDNYKDRKEDPGSSHPATTAVGEKYSSMNLEQLCKTATELGNAILADVAKEATQTKAPPAAAPAATQKKANESCSHSYVGGKCSKCGCTEGAMKMSADGKSAEPEPTEAEKAAAAGYELAGAVGSATAEDLDIIVQTIKEAEEQAVILEQYLRDFEASQAEQAKKAAEEEEEERKGPPPAPGENGESEAAETSSSTTPGGGGDLLAQLAGAGGGMGGMPPGAGGPPGMPPEMGGGGMPPDMAGMGGGMGGMPPGAGGGAPDEAQLQELAALLAELGITPEELASVATAKSANALVKMQKAAAALNGNAKAQKSASQRELMRQHILELVGKK